MRYLLMERGGIELHLSCKQILHRLKLLNVFHMIMLWPSQTSLNSSEFWGFTNFDKETLVQVERPRERLMIEDTKAQDK